MQTWPRGDTKTYTYSTMRDLLGVTYMRPSGTGPSEIPDTPNVEYPEATYDRLGRPGQVIQHFASGPGLVDLTHLSSASAPSEELYAVDHPYLGRVHLKRENLQTNGRYQRIRVNRTGSTLLYAPLTSNWDDLGRLQSLTQSGFHTSYTYHGTTGLKETVTTGPSVANATFRSTYHADLLGRTIGVQSQTLTGANPGTVTRVGYQYDHADRRTRLTREDGTYWHYKYNNRGELVDGRKHLPDATRLRGQEFTYDYDGIGNRLTAGFGVDAAGKKRPVISYTPNNENQYTRITHPGKFPLLVRTSDKANLTFKAAGVTLTPVTSQGTWHHAEGSRGGADWQDVPVEISHSGTTKSGKVLVPPASRDPQYDANGNLTNDGYWRYRWNSDNRLVSMQTIQSDRDQTGEANYRRLDFVYDWRGRRIAKTVKGQNNAILLDLRYVYDDWNLLAEVAVNTDGSLKDVLRDYYWGLDLSGSKQGAGGVGGLLAARIHQRNGNSVTKTTYYPSFDGNGNILAWTKRDGEVAQKLDYDPFGNVLSQQEIEEIPGEGIPYGFSTKYTDQETGLLYYGYRYYDPVIGRWPSRDPIGEQGGENLYSFVFNQSISHFDLFGLMSETQCFEVLFGPFRQIPRIISERSGSSKPSTGAKWRDVLQDLGNWWTGTLPPFTYYGPDHPKSIALSKSSIGKELVDAIGKLDRWSNNHSADDWDDNVGETADDIKTTFRPYWEAIVELKNPTASFVGRATGEITVHKTSKWSDCGEKSVFVNGNSQRSPETQTFNAKCKTISFKMRLINVTTFKSGAYHIPGTGFVDPPKGIPFSAWTQVYEFDHKFTIQKTCGKPTKRRVRCF